jgi:hypothetical protein
MYFQSKGKISLHDFSETGKMFILSQLPSPVSKGLFKNVFIST